MTQEKVERRSEVFPFVFVDVVVVAEEGVGVHAVDNAFVGGGAKIERGGEQCLDRRAEIIFQPHLIAEIVEWITVVRLKIHPEIISYI